MVSLLSSVGTRIQTLGSPKEDMLIRVLNTYLPQFCLQIQTTLLQCSAVGSLPHILVGSVDVHVSAISIDEQGLSESPLHLGKVILITPLVAISTVVSTSVLCHTDMTFCLNCVMSHRGSAHGGSLATFPGKELFRIGP